MGKVRLFYGWWIVAAAMVGECFCHGSLVIYTFSCFLKPLAQAFHASRGPTALAVSLTNLAVAFALPAVGWLSDRYGPRRIILVGVAGTGLAIAGMSRMQAPLWHLYLIFAIIGVMGTAAGPVTYRRVVASWFDRRRGLALGLTSVGLGLGALIMPLLAQGLIDRAGWRAAYVALGGLSLVVALPLVALLLRERPAEMGLSPDGATAPAGRTSAAESVGMSLAEAMRTRAFWQLCFLFACISGCVIGTTLHLVPMLTDRGETAAKAARAAAAFGLATILGRILTGCLIDRLFAPRVLACFMVGATLGLVLLFQGAVAGGAQAAAFLLGLGVGAETDVMPYLVSRYFGLRCMGAIFACAFTSHVVGLAAGSFLLGAGFDATGSYRMPVGAGAALMAVAIGAALSLGPYAPAAAAEPAVAI